jgi:thiosulfate/3-mercaptopyruvate sulfurtransferase
MAGYEYINKNLKKLLIIDARSKEEYDGTVIRGARGGRIPGAINIDWNLNIAEDGTIKDNKTLSELYKLPKDAEIVTYCQGAYRAANSFLALKKLGFQNVKVYLGSWGEWANRMNLPVE